MQEPDQKQGQCIAGVFSDLCFVQAMRRRCKAPDSEDENARGRCGRTMQMAQGKASTSCHEAIREEKKASKRLKLDREHKERDKSWI